MKYQIYVSPAQAGDKPRLRSSFTAQNIEIPGYAGIYFFVKIVNSC